MEIRPLQISDDRAGFRSGDPELDRFFAKFAGQNQFRHHIGTTYVAAESGRVLGYATIAAGSLEGESLPAALRRGLPGYPLPILRLARLAVDAAAHGRGVGSALVRHVFGLALRMAQDFGCVGLLVDAKPGARDFYDRLGFSVLEVVQGGSEERPAPTAMFLPLALVRIASQARR